MPNLSVEVTEELMMVLARDMYNKTFFSIDSRLVCFSFDLGLAIDFHPT